MKGAAVNWQLIRTIPAIPDQEWVILSVLPAILHGHHRNVRIIIRPTCLQNVLLHPAEILKAIPVPAGKTDHAPPI